MAPCEDSQGSAGRPPAGSTHGATKTSWPAAARRSALALVLGALAGTGLLVAGTGLLVAGAARGQGAAPGPAAPDGGAPLESTSLDGGADAGEPWPSWAWELVDRTTPTELERDIVAGGYWVRVGTNRGPVHLWMPREYQAKRAATVVYLHGFYTNVDTAWDEHRLAWQFRASELNALFIAPETVSGRVDDMPWKQLSELLATVTRRARLALPSGPLLLAGHSGAYRNLFEWFDDERATRLALLDGFYGQEEDVAAWLERGRRRAWFVALQYTAPRTELFLRRYAQVAVRDEVPGSLDELSPQERAAPLVLWKSTRYEHMSLVTSGEVLPLVLRSTGLPMVQRRP